MKKLTQVQVKKMFDYREDGNLVWKVSPTNSVRVGDIAGSENIRGHSDVSICRNRYKLHRIIWLWHYGYMPENEIDHINRNPSDNRVENLRHVSHQCNLRNIGNLISNTSGVKGVSFQRRRKRWRATITVNGKQKTVGELNDFAEIVLLRLAAEQCLDWYRCDKLSPAYKYALAHGLISPRRK